MAEISISDTSSNPTTRYYSNTFSRTMTDHTLITLTITEINL